MSHQIPQIITDDNLLKAEAVFYAKLIVRVAPAADRTAIAAYGKHVGDGTKPSHRETVSFYSALATAQGVGHLPGYGKVVSQLKDWPERYGQFEDLIAQTVYTLAENGA